MDKQEFNLRLIKTYVNKHKEPIFIGEEFDVFTYEVEMDFINIDWKSSSMRIENSGKETYFTFDSLGKIHGIKCVNDVINRSVLIERYHHNIPHGEWTFDQPFGYWVKNYVNGVLHGPFKNLEKSTKIKGNFKNNKYDGDIEYFDMIKGNPKLSITEKYKDGVLLQTIHEEEPQNKPDTIVIPLTVKGGDKRLFWKF
jgi:hypothetical protein